MKRNNQSGDLSELLKYLSLSIHDDNRLPSLPILSEELGISISSLREQLEVARSLGFVEVRQKTGIKRLPYVFKPAVSQSLAYAVAINPDLFKYYSDLRKRLEMAYWYEAVNRLQKKDYEYLLKLTSSAIDRMEGEPIQIPHREHREFHLLIYSRTNNVFVTGLLESYWDIYEAIGLSVYTDLKYLKQVWEYHQRIINSISVGDFEGGYWALVEHFGLLEQRTKPGKSQIFE